MVIRYVLKCSICGHRSTTRTAIGHGDYQEFAFPCPGCGVEIRYGMNLLLRKRLKRAQGKSSQRVPQGVLKRIASMDNIKFVNLVNAKHCRNRIGATELETLDGETLKPVSQMQFSPFMANVGLVRDWPTFSRDQGMRFDAVERFLPQIQRLWVHLERKQWKLFDKEFCKLELSLPITSESERIKAMFKATEAVALFFTPFTDGVKAWIRQRIMFAENTSATSTKDLMHYFTSMGKDATIDQQLRSIRLRWEQYYGFLSPIYTCIYWNDREHSLDDFTLAQKRFQELKPFYVDCFETFCRIAVIAAGLESVVFGQPLGVATTKRVMPLADFDTMANGAKRDILKNLAVDGIFVPFIDHELRNGIGHHSAQYDVGRDVIHYEVENRKKFLKLQISYVRFCEKVVKLYSQLEVVSIYAHWLRKKSLGIS